MGRDLGNGMDVPPTDGVKSLIDEDDIRLVIQLRMAKDGMCIL